MDDEPTIAFGPSQIWIDGRQHPDAIDFWDGNWVQATAQCIGDGLLRTYPVRDPKAGGLP